MVLRKAVIWSKLYYFLGQIVCEIVFWIVHNVWINTLVCLFLFYV